MNQVYLFVEKWQETCEMMRSCDNAHTDDSAHPTVALEVCVGDTVTFRTKSRLGILRVSPLWAP
jgi:hypothetical protein